VVQRSNVSAANVHARSATNRLQSLQDLDVRRVVTINLSNRLFLSLCHVYIFALLTGFRYPSALTRS